MLQIVAENMKIVLREEHHSKLRVDLSVDREREREREREPRSFFEGDLSVSSL
jgi:hypothetical protein